MQSNSTNRLINLVILILIISAVFVIKTTYFEEIELVIDDAGIIAEDKEKNLTEYHDRLLQYHDIDLRVITTEVSKDINLFTAEKFKELEVGKLSKSGRGLLLVIDTSIDMVRMEVGRSLEGIYTDSFISYIENQQMVYFLRSNRVDDGIMATTEMIVTRAQEAKENKEFEPPVGFEASTGAGAATKANIGAGKVVVDNTHLSAEFAVAASPKDLVLAYIKAMKNRNSRPDLSIYTESTKSMLKNWVVTPAQMNNVVKAYKKCSSGRVITRGNFAVVRYGVKERLCSPYFLRKEAGAWKLDLTMMQKALNFNHNNQWRLRPEVKHSFRFAFTDWRFDKNGFPFPKRKLRWGVNMSYSPHGTLITNVVKGSAAEAMGLQKGDLIQQWAGKNRPDHRYISRHMKKVEEGVKVVAVVYRNSLQITLTTFSPPKP